MWRGSRGFFVFGDELALALALVGLGVTGATEEDVESSALAMRCRARWQLTFRNHTKLKYRDPHSCPGLWNVRMRYNWSETVF